MHTVSSLPHLLRSLLVALCLGFLIPNIGILLVLFTFAFLGYVPGLLGMSQMGLQALETLLLTFGSGSVWEGAFVIGAAFALVSLLFDSYIIYRNHIL